MFFKEVKLDMEEMQRLLAEDAVGVVEYMDRYTTRRFYIGDTGINRKTLNDWENNGLLPYEYTGDGWRKFSFVEWVWLECIIELRQLGVSLEKIKDLKKLLFDLNVDEFIGSTKERFSVYEGKIDQKETVLAAFDNTELTPEIKKQFVQRTQLSYFLPYLLFLVINEPNLCLGYNNHNFCTFFVLGGVEQDMKESNEAVISKLVDDSFVVLNLRKIVNNIFQKPDLRHHDDFILDFLSPKEKAILDEIRNTNAKEILITFDNESNPTHIKVNRNRISKETLNKVARYLKKGNYQTVEFTTRDGQLIKYEETDIIKLDN